MADLKVTIREELTLNDNIHIGSCTKSITKL